MASVLQIYSPEEAESRIDELQTSPLIEDEGGKVEGIMESIHNRADEELKRLENGVIAEYAGKDMFVTSLSPEINRPVTATLISAEDRSPESTYYTARDLETVYLFHQSLKHQYRRAQLENTESMAELKTAVDEICRNNHYWAELPSELEDRLIGEHRRPNPDYVGVTESYLDDHKAEFITGTEDTEESINQIIDYLDSGRESDQYHVQLGDEEYSRFDRATAQELLKRRI